MSLPVGLDYNKILKFLTDDQLNQVDFLKTLNIPIELAKKEHIRRTLSSESVSSLNYKYDENIDKLQRINTAIEKLKGTILSLELINTVIQEMLLERHSAAVEKLAEEAEQQLTEEAISAMNTSEVAPPVEEVVPPVEEVAPPVEEVDPPVEEVSQPAEVALPAEEVDPPVEEVAPPAEVALPAEEVSPQAQVPPPSTPPPLNTDDNETVYSDSEYEADAWENKSFIQFSASPEPSDEPAAKRSKTNILDRLGPLKNKTDPTKQYIQLAPNFIQFENGSIHYNQVEEEVAPYELEIDVCTNPWQSCNCGKPHWRSTTVKKGSLLPKRFCFMSRPWILKTNGFPIKCLNPECNYIHPVKKQSDFRYFNSS